MKTINELKTKNYKAEFITLAKSCTCSICGDKIMAGARFLRIKSKLFGTRNYCSAVCMQHPMVNSLSISEEYTRFSNLMDQFDMTELPDGLKLSTTDNYEEFLKCYNPKIAPYRATGLPQKSPAGNKIPTYKELYEAMEKKLEGK